MKNKLDESRNWEARELIRRLEIVELSPLSGGEEIGKYLDVKFARLGRERSSIVSDSGCQALAARMSRQAGRGSVVSAAWPLSVNNWVRQALNLAAELGSERVDAEIVNGL